jgi:hypothetical protein
MNNVARIFSVSAVALALLSGVAHADQSKTSEQVQAAVGSASADSAARDQELASLTAAARVGEISTNEVAMIMRELYPAPSSEAAAAGGIAKMGSSTTAN